VPEKPETRWKLRCKNKKCGREFDIAPSTFRSNKKRPCPHCGKPSTYHTPDVLKLNYRKSESN
jgi:rRNA maturation endonuclease Nob1